MMWFLALVGALSSQESPEDLKKEVEKLRVQVRELQDRLGQLEDAAVSDAQLIQRLRTAIKMLETSNPSPVVPGTKPPENEKGPVNVLKGRVIHVNSKPDFLLIDLGRDKKIEQGCKFEIVRRTFDKENQDGRLQKIGVAEFEKYIGEEASTSKLRVVEGSAADMKVEDEAVAIRSLPPVKEPAKMEIEKSKNGVYKITGLAGRGALTGFTINYGLSDGAKQTDMVFVYKDGIFKSKLRLDTVTRDFSVGNLIAPAADPMHTPEVGDQVFTREFQKSLAGKVALVDPQRGLVATDLRQRDGVHIGQKLEVRRLGQRVGLISVTDVQAWGSWAKLEGDTKLDTIQKGDFVEAVEDK
jgi:hypothetical protein